MELYDGASYRINIEGLDSTLIVDSYRGIIKANLVDNDDFVLVDYDSRTFYGELAGNITDNLGNIILDSEQKLFKGDLVGNIFAEDGTIVYDLINNHLAISNLTVSKTITVDQLKVNFPIEGDLFGNLTGDILNKTTGQVVYDSIQNSLFINDLVVENVINGSLVGDILNKATGQIVYDSIQNSLSIDEIYVNNAINGDLVGNIFSKNGMTVYNIESNSISVDSISTNSIFIENEISGTFTGTFVGDIYNSLGEKILDVDDKSLTIGFMQGDILSEKDGIAYDSTTNTFFGKFYGSLISDVVNIENLVVGENTSGGIIIYNNTDIEDDFGAVSIYNYKTSESYSSITLTRGRGDITNRLPVEPGDKLNAILFSAHTGFHLADEGPVALLGAKIANDAVITPEGAAGEVSLLINNYNNQLIEGFVVDANGYMKTVLKEFSVIGNTNKSPVNLTTHLKWLEINVNGEIMFIPLYQ